MSAKIFLLSKKAYRDIYRLPLRIHNQIGRAFDIITENPIAGAKLHGELEDQYKFRIGDYRIIYKFDSKESKVEILKIEHRQGVYR